MSARSSGSTAAPATPTISSAAVASGRGRLRNDGFMNGRAASIAAAATAGSACRAAGSFAGIVDMVEVGARNGIAIPRHDGIRQAITLIRLDPGLDAAGALQHPQTHYQDAEQFTHGYSRIN